LSISVVVRTRDKERYLANLLESLAQQTVQASEIVVVDNFSTEESRRALEENLREMAERFFRNSVVRLKLATLRDNEFSHAYSTNLGASVAENELVCITNAHSLPISRSWLYDGSRYFKDSNVAGVSGFFIPHRDGTVAGTLDTLLYYYGQRATSHKDWFCTMTCIIRKELWKTYPFDENLPSLVPETKKYGLEDYDWGQEMKARGYAIVVDPLFSVFHSHTRGVDEIGRNMKNYFVYRRIQQKIKSFCRPRESFTKAFPVDYPVEIWP
jgi:glycosyltransferase involved in cell wall biosynthesis